MPLLLSKQEQEIYTLGRKIKAEQNMTEDEFHWMMGVVFGGADPVLLRAVLNIGVEDSHKMTEAAMRLPFNPT